LTDERLARDFQRRYFAGQRGAMAGLYAECRHIASALAKAYCWKYGLQISDERMEDTVQLALSRVLSRYRNPEYFIRSFRAVLNDEIVHELSNHKGPKAQFQKAIVPLVEDPASEGDPPTNGSHLAYFNEIYMEPEGRGIILALSRARSFRGAITDVEQIAGRKWCYQFAVQLRYVYQHMSHGKKGNHGELGRRHNSRDAAPDRIHKRVQAKGKQAHLQRGSGEDARHVEPSQ
jgi:hypothetical protein